MHQRPAHDCRLLKAWYSVSVKKKYRILKKIKIKLGRNG
jgi:hypothetical protein